MAPRLLSLPMHPNLSNEQTDYVVERLSAAVAEVGAA